ncbi:MULTISPECIES: flagellar hook assembly protein FlgD [Frigoribacterium]|jgi:flagellar basal-body rod modification protein FlgD|uniref:flagellar hook assembly protein FlgD n=1 Tax=Frigoribacterium TaxID=96492 RepID=UPI0005C2B36B|nr:MULTISPECIES: flagellar hook capping FlgD N-terminal domain-containing protein [Frigoribacterium]KIU01884.1 flagellar hook capping protein [Frigoribacterium sp. MEB024]KQM29417.1 flagellar hook capping protein [Frigoribacterium sp. Leaf8]MBD8140924.1 flagellar hook capping protein [Frigoribacterium sp. CFBP 13605]MBD8484852.1 flagellar hook capping protein [Frigoribacterium sp. CFBP 8759]MBD8537852.1 flagellar hook capping protein [Frigoribacterium sp. CFBP 8751]
MPSIDQISGTVDVATQIAAANAAKSGSSRATANTMDSEMFMKLLVTQLKNQDPSTPMDTNAMMSQTTQLAMMEQVTAQTTTANENFSLQMRIAASNLVGREVSYTGPDGVEVKGTATSVSFAEAVPKVSVGGKEVALDLISGIATTKA